jgi:SulP family sulfate permease
VITGFAQRFRGSLLPGFNLAIVVLPQAIAFSFLAGVPPQFGIYCAIYGVLITCLVNPSSRFHGGPNSSMSVAISVALLPYAPQFGNEYMGYLLSLAVMIGIVQLLFASLRPLSRLMDFMSEAVVSGLIFGIGLFLIFKSIAPFGGLPLNTQVHWPLAITWQTFQSLSEFGNPYAIEVGFVTLVTAVVTRAIRPIRGWYLITGLVAGTLYSEYLIHNYGGLTVTLLEQVGKLDLRLLQPSLPTFSPEALADLLSLIPSAIAIALLGIFQTAAIMRRTRHITGEQIGTRQAVFADAVANITAGFISALPGCGSFNRVALMHSYEVDSSVAAALSAVFLGLLIFLAKDFIAIIPLPSMAALIMLVGANMLRISEIRHHFKSPIETMVFLAAFASVHIFGLLDAALIGAGFAFIDWVWHKAHPYVEIHGNRVSIYGDLYYASVGYAEPQIAYVVEHYPELDIDLTHTHYIDAEASRWLAEAGKKRDCKTRFIVRERQRRVQHCLLDIAEIDESRITLVQTWTNHEGGDDPVTESETNGFARSD